jgi:hypothetical protein
MTEQQKDAVEVKKKEAQARWSVSKVKKQKEKRAGQTQGENDDANQKRRDVRAALTKEEKEEASRKRKPRDRKRYRCAQNSRNVRRFYCSSPERSADRQ